MSLFNRLAAVKGQAAVSQPRASAPAGVLDGGREVATPFGSFYLIEGEYTGTVAFPPVDREAVCRNLKLLYGIGPAKETALKEKGYPSLNELAAHGRWGDKALAALDIIQQSDVRALRRLGARDSEILPCFRPEDLVFLDIETTGLWASQPLFLIGLLYQQGGKLVARQLLARSLREERPLLFYLIQELSRSSLIVTFNGKKFDIPYIEGRTVEHRLYYRCGLEHIDLLFHARRHYRGKLPDCRLVTLEEHLLGSRREGDIPGHMIPEIYYRFVRTQNPELIKDILHHNVLDLLAMAEMFYLVGEKLPG